MKILKKGGNKEKGGGGNEIHAPCACAKNTHLNIFRISEILKKDLFAYPFFALTRQQLKTENNKLNIYTQYLMKSTFETTVYDFFFTGPSDLWNYSFYTPVYNFTRHGPRTST
jgi:hypothetical protein